MSKNNMDNNFTPEQWLSFYDKPSNVPYSGNVLEQSAEKGNL